MTLWQHQCLLNKVLFPVRHIDSKGGLNTGVPERLVCCGEALVLHILGGMSEEQCGGGAPLAMGVVMRRGGAVAGAGGGGLT